MAMEGKDGILSVSDRATASPMATCRRSAGRVLVIADGDKTQGRCAGDEAGRGVGRRCAARRSRRLLRRRRPASTTALAFNGAAGGDRRSRRQCRRRRALGQYHILRHLIERGVEDACGRPDLGPDRRAHLLRRRASARRSTLRFGGKIAPTSGQPVDADGRGDRAEARRAGRASARPRCRSATAPPIRIGGVDVVLITNRTQALGLELFTNLGIDPRAEEDRGGEVDQPFHGGLRADRQRR